MPDRFRAGAFAGGMPYLVTGEGPPLVYLQGFAPEHVNPQGLAAKATLRVIRPLATAGFTVYSVNRRPNLPAGSTMADIAADHAAALTSHFGEPVHVIGHSTGGSIALQLIADHSEVVRKAVVASAAYRLGPVVKKAQWDMVQRIAHGRRGYHLLAPGFTRNPLLRRVITGLLWTVDTFVPRPKDTADMVAMATAEDGFDVYHRLGQISTETLVICGARDYFWTPEMFADTANLMPNGKLIMYPGVGHAVNIKPQFFRDVLTFLRD